VEISSRLSEIARQNFDRSRSRLICKDLDIETVNAIEYRLPADASVLYFNNPFSGDLLDKVLRNIQIFSASHPVIVLCNLPNRCAFDAQIRKADWLFLQKEFRLSGERYCLIFRSLHDR
jgi:hypothetical protein